MKTVQRKWKTSRIAATLLVAACAAGGLVTAVAQQTHAPEKEDANEQTLTADQLPAAVAKSLGNEAKGAQIVAIEVETHKNKQIYEADVMFGKLKYELQFAPNGDLLKKELDREDDARENAKGEKGEVGEEREVGEEHESAAEERGEKSEEAEADEHETTVTLAQVPAPVRTALLKETAGGRIESIEVEQEHGAATYEADSVTNGVKWEIKVAADGLLLKKARDNGDDAHEADEAGERDDD